MSDYHDLTVVIKEKSGTTIETDIVAVTSFNENGKFDILGLHENFITIIKDIVVLHKKDGTQKEMKITRGVIKNNQNAVSIYLGI
jgi:F0F1-type ATP synthase epsilon subunit